MKSLNLDELVPEDKILILGGEEFKIPGDISFKDLLIMAKAEEKFTDSGNSTEELENLLKTISEVVKVPFDKLENLSAALIKNLSDFILDREDSNDPISGESVEDPTK